jgi:hypothetical protein
VAHRTQRVNIFIDDLLVQLNNSDDKVCIGSFKINSFAYADDVTLLSTTVPGLQRVIDISCDYARKWKFRFGLNKSKCMISGNHCFDAPKWHLNGEKIQVVDSLEILGVTFDNRNSHIESRVSKCRRAFYSLRDAGLAYPGCSTNVKSYLWKSICQPVLLYGSECLNMSEQSLKTLDTTQGNLLKQALGFSKRCRSSTLFQALRVEKPSHLVSKNCASLMHRIMLTPSPAQDINACFLSLFLCKNVLIPGTLVQRLVGFNLSPVSCAFNKCKPVSDPESGVVDSLRQLLCHTNFIKPYSEQHVLANLLLRAF